MTTTKAATHEPEMLEYRVKFDYPDGEEYNSGKVLMTTEQASAMFKFLSALEDEQRICHGWYCGQFYEGTVSFNDLLTDLESEFDPEDKHCYIGEPDSSLLATW